MALDPDTRHQIWVAVKVVGIGVPIVVVTLFIWSIEEWSNMELLLAATLFDPVVTVLIAILLLRERQQPPPPQVPVYQPPPGRPDYIR